MPTERETRAEGASIDARVEGKTIGDILARNAEQHGDSPALSWKDGETWSTMSWGDYRTRVAEVAMGLQDPSQDRSGRMQAGGHGRGPHCPGHA
jgi:long-subunit acyl-CoA synthetase (AMP-forming)